MNLRALRCGAKNPSVKIHPKLRNFVEDDFDFFGYEQGRSSTTVVAGRLKSHIKFWRSRSIGASNFILDVIDHGYRNAFCSLHPLLVSLLIISQLWRILILLTKLFPNCWLPIAFLNRKFCLITSTLFPFLFSHLGRRG